VSGTGEAPGVATAPGFDTFSKPFKIDGVFPVAAPGLVWRNINAEVAELADAHGSGPCTRKGVGVRVPSSAPA
jgi:hypothetical protein